MQNLLENKKILLGITGGIAAYKSAELVRSLQAAGASVRVTMTPAATAFITPITLQALSGHKVYTGLFEEHLDTIMCHINLARWADLILIAPASADFIARLAHGLANDLLSTICLAATCYIAVAPAMNRLMWENEATRANCSLLSSRGIRIWGPGLGNQACGETGYGRMLEPSTLCKLVVDYLNKDKISSKFLENTKILITAGPTREAIDPVRFISNKSTGKMGFAVAEAAASAGAEVILVSGPVCITPPLGMSCIMVESAIEMYNTVMNQIQGIDIFIAAAAVADYRSTIVSKKKIKKSLLYLTLDFIKNPDILASVATLQLNRPFTVGFSAETHNILQNAQSKLHCKNLDMIVANQVGIPGTGFESDQNELFVLWIGGSQSLPRAEKHILGKQLIKIIYERYQHWKKRDDKAS